MRKARRSSPFYALRTAKGMPGRWGVYRKLVSRPKLISLAWSGEGWITPVIQPQSAQLRRISEEKALEVMLKISQLRNIPYTRQQAKRKLKQRPRGRSPTAPFLFALTRPRPMDILQCL
jgi:hypothetical protein